MALFRAETALGNGFYSVTPFFERPVVSAGKQTGQTVSDCGCDFSSSGEASAICNLLRGGKRTADDLLCSVYYPLESLFVCCRASGIPRCSVLHRDARYGGAVKGH